jgi:arsenical pump membrane protein
MTPVLLHAARHRGASEEPFLYGAAFMANAASLLLPGSNLTNLIVLSRDPMSGAAFAGRLAPGWAVSVVLTATFVALVFRRRLYSGEPMSGDEVAVRLGPGGVGIAVGTVLVLVLARPALPVLALGIAVALASGLRPREMATVANVPLLVGLLGLAVLLGTAARAAGSLADPLQAAGRWESAWLAAGASLLVNNLPAAVMLSSHLPAHPSALLLGLDLGPNLAVTGSLSAILWLRVAHESGARPSVLRYSLLGLVLVPLTLSAALLVPAA